MPKFKLGNHITNRWRIVKWYNAATKWRSLLLATAAYSGVGGVDIFSICGGIVRAQLNAAKCTMPRCDTMQCCQTILAQARCMFLPAFT